MLEPHPIISKLPNNYQPLRRAETPSSCGQWYFWFLSIPSFNDYNELFRDRSRLLVTWEPALGNNEQDATDSLPVLNVLLANQCVERRILRTQTPDQLDFIYQAQSIAKSITRKQFRRVAGWLPQLSLRQTILDLNPQQLAWDLRELRVY